MIDNAQAIQVRIGRKEQAAEDIVLFEFVEAQGRILPPFSAGSHIDVTMPGGITRQYSLCNDASDSNRYLIAVLKDAQGRGGSRAMHESVHEGDVITISSPKNHFPLAQSAQRSILLAGGIGITPLLCMAERLAMSDAPFELHYCTRSRQRTAFLERISQSRFAHQVHLHLDDEALDQQLQLQNVLGTVCEGVHIYTCGPKGFMDAVLAAARSYGWPEDQLHYEFFTAEPAKLATDGAFVVQLASSGRLIQVGPKESVVQALSAHGVKMPTSCEQGVCGTCLTRVLEGEPDHRDLYLSAQEQAANDQFLPCCSRAKSAFLLLDL